MIEELELEEAAQELWPACLWILLQSSTKLRHAKLETSSKVMSTSLYILTRKPGDDLDPSKNKAPCRLAPAQPLEDQSIEPQLSALVCSLEELARYHG